MKRQTAFPRITLFAQGPTYCAVCAPQTVSPEIIERAVALRNRDEPDAEWKVLSGSFAGGRLNARTCPHDGSRQHWLVMRVSA
jgi:hypothetical protein